MRLPRRGRQTCTTVLKVLGIFIPLAVWWIAAWTELLPYLPAPPKVLVTFARERMVLWSHWGATLLRASAGFGIGSILGIAVALVMAWNRWIRALFTPPILLMRTVPVLGLIPIFILWFGIGEASKITFVALICFFLVITFAAEAIRNVPVIYSWAALSLGLTLRDVYRRVTLPAIVPGIIGGLRVSITAAPMLTLAAELIGARRGLGSYMAKAQTMMQLDKMILVVILITILAVLGDLLMLGIARVATKWSERT